MLMKAARKLLATCSSCGCKRPLDSKTGHCWPGNNLVSQIYPCGATDRQQIAHGEMCNDCAFLSASPEAQPGSVDPLSVMHMTMPGDAERFPVSLRDVVVLQARTANGIFWC